MSYHHNYYDDDYDNYDSNTSAEEEEWCSKLISDFSSLFGSCNDSDTALAPLALAMSVTSARFLALAMTVV